MDKRIPPLPPKRPIPQKPNIVKEPQTQNLQSAETTEIETIKEEKIEESKTDLNSLQNEKINVNSKKEKKTDNVDLAKLNEKYRTIILSLISGLCFVGAIVCFVFLLI